MIQVVVSVKLSDHCRRLDESAERRAWVAFKRYGDASARDRLIESNIGLAEYCASRVRRKMPPHGFDYDDVYSYAIEGLIGAVDRYSLDCSVKFVTYAIPRIHGAVIDAMRQFYPRTLSAIPARIEAERRLTEVLKRPPSDQELAAECGVSERAIKNGRIRYAAFRMKALTDEMAADIRDDSQRAMDDVVADLDMAQRALRHLSELPIRHQLITRTWLYLDPPHCDLSDVFGVSETRVTQLLSVSFYYVRKRLEGTPARDIPLTYALARAPRRDGAGMRRPVTRRRSRTRAQRDIMQTMSAAEIASVPTLTERERDMLISRYVHGEPMKVLEERFGLYTGGGATRARQRAEVKVLEHYGKTIG